MLVTTWWSTDLLMSARTCRTRNSRRRGWTTRGWSWGQDVVLDGENGTDNWCLSCARRSHGGCELRVSQRWRHLSRLKWDLDPAMCPAWNVVHSPANRRCTHSAWVLLRELRQSTSMTHHLYLSALTVAVKRWPDSADHKVRAAHFTYLTMK